MDYITPVNELYCEFSSLTLWETIIKTAKTISIIQKQTKNIQPFERIYPKFTCNTRDYCTKP